MLVLVLGALAFAVRNQLRESTVVRQVPPAPGVDRIHRVFPNGPATDDAGASIGTAPAPPPIDTPEKDGEWVAEIDLQDGSLDAGDQCCGGYCEHNGPMGALVCSNTPPSSSCSATAADCCVPATCA